jgi:hypothetical protein
VTKLQSLAVVTTLSPIQIQLRASQAFSQVQLRLIASIADLKPVGPNVERTSPVGCAERISGPHCPAWTCEIAYLVLCPRNSRHWNCFVWRRRNARVFGEQVARSHPLISIVSPKFDAIAPANWYSVPGISIVSPEFT